MQDFDFDEIDRAVSGAIGDSPATPAAAPVVPSTPPVSDSVATPAARRSTGRFMDVVHPSSDMRSASTVPPRQESVPTTPPPVPPVIEEQPQTSPFLTDAKVEKRPLGGTPPVTQAPDPFNLGSPVQELIEAPDEPRIEATNMPDPIDFVAQTPDITPAPEASPEAAVPAQQPEAVTAIETPVVDSAEPMVETAPVSEAPVGPTSITQQYTEQASSADNPGAIYDTEAYHQPVVAPVKKKSGGLVILWIALLVLFGAGAGAAVYFFVLPML